jgi:hypothetical protein
MNRSQRPAVLIATLLISCLVIGCDDDQSPSPITALNILADSMAVEVAYSVSIPVEVTGGESGALNWYVNGIAGGDSEVGAVSGSGSTVYTAPDAVPDPAIVTVTAVSRDDPAAVDSCRVTVRFTTIHVNAATGSDATGTGLVSKPVKSITAGLDLADPGLTVQVAPGTYDVANGEVFPLALPDSVSLVGEDWVNTVIRGHGENARYYHAVEIRGERSALRKFTIEQGEEGIEPWRIAVYVADPATHAHVDSLRVLERPRYSVLRVWYAPGTVVENCYFVTADDAREAHGIEVNIDYGDLVFRGSTLSGFWAGLALNNLCDPLVEGCTFERNNMGIELCCDWDENHNPNPDLGGGARSSLGGNTIRDSSDCGIANGSTNTIYAKHNTWQNDPPVEGVDFCNTSTGEVIWE